MPSLHGAVEQCDNINDRTLDSRNDLRIALRVREEYLELPSAIIVAGDGVSQLVYPEYVILLYYILACNIMSQKKQILRTKGKVRAYTLSVAHILMIRFLRKRCPVFLRLCRAFDSSSDGFRKQYYRHFNSFSMTQ